MVLRGHQGRVNCLLYPHGESSRYDMAHLVSGGIDFSINVWDMYTGNLVHRFVVQAGQILQLLVPPPTCTVSYTTVFGAYVFHVLQGLLCPFPVYTWSDQSVCYDSTKRLTASNEISCKGEIKGEYQ